MAIAPPPGSSAASSTGPGADRTRARRVALTGVIRVLVVTATLVGAYAAAPIGQRPGSEFAVRLTLSLLVLIGVLTWEISEVSRSPHPTVRGVEAVAVSASLLVLTFAAAYVGTEYATPGAFTEPLSRVDAVYFSVTVLTTVGFGDIAPESAVARLLVMSQMVVDMVLVAVIANVLVGAVRRRRDALQES